MVQGFIWNASRRLVAHSTRVIHRRGRASPKLKPRLFHRFSTIKVVKGAGLLLSLPSDRGAEMFVFEEG
jgi:hypothetical protein